MTIHSNPNQPNGLVMLQAASIALDVHVKDKIPILSTPSSIASTNNPAPLSALLNPVPTTTSPIPVGYVLGKDGKIKKKRGRKPTPGLSEEDRRQARLLKNRRTAETSRRRKLALLNRLTTERDVAKQHVQQLKQINQLLISRLAKTLGKSVEQLLIDEPTFNFQQQQLQSSSSIISDSNHHDSSNPTSVAGSDSEHGNKK